MQKSLGGFRAALLIGWPALSAAGLLYARAKGIPTWAAVPVLAAFLIEYPFYLLLGFESARDRLAGAMPDLQLGLFLGASGLLPYLVYSIPTHQFHWLALAQVAALAFTVSLWYSVLPRAPVFDGLFLILLAAVMLQKFFNAIYVPPLAALRGMEVLGHLMLIHLAAMAVLFLRRFPVPGLGFLPNWKEWKIGLWYFLLFLPVGFPIALLLRVVTLSSAAFVWWKVLGTFIGIWWVVAFSEEFFFRGLLQSWLCSWTGNPTVALLLASAFYGLAHVAQRGFPNWRMVLITAILGGFCGRAYFRANSIRAAMVTHALAATIFRTVFST
jgi:membrane protease YdiL (CAAX protease family)